MQEGSSHSTVRYSYKSFVQNILGYYSPKGEYKYLHTRPKRKHAPVMPTNSSHGAVWKRSSEETLASA